MLNKHSHLISAMTHCFPGKKTDDQKLRLRKFTQVAHGRGMANFFLALNFKVYMSIIFWDEL